MRIISKQKDYYDGVQAYNDQSIIYLRKQKEFNIKEHRDFDCKKPEHINEEEIKQSFNYGKVLDPEGDWTTRIYYHNRDDTFKYFNNQLMFVGFCGKIYTGIIFNLSIKDNKFQQYCYSSDDFDKLFNRYSTKKEKKKYIVNELFGRHLKFMKTKLSEPLTMINHDLFFKYNTPCFIILPSKGLTREDGQFIVSPVLKKYQFTKVYDPYTTFQEIEMFLSGVLCDTKEPSVIDDKSMLFKKGFNNMSFKTEKGTKKPRSLKRRNK